MDLARKFAENTSLGGMSYMNNSNRWWSTAFWIFIFVVGLVLCTAHLYLIFQNYYGYPYATIDELKYDLLPFPSVTVCNRNPIRVSGMSELSQEMQDHLKAMAPPPQDEHGRKERENGTTNATSQDTGSRDMRQDTGSNTTESSERNRVCSSLHGIWWKWQYCMTKDIMDSLTLKYF